LIDIRHLTFDIRQTYTTDRALQTQQTLLRKHKLPGRNFPADHDRRRVRYREKRRQFVTAIDAISPWPQRTPFLGSFYLCLYPLSQNYHIWRANTYGEGACFYVVRPPPRRSGVLALPNFCGLFRFMLTPFVAELPNLTW